MEEKKHRGSRMVCMPVGGTGIKAPTAQMLIAIFRKGLAEAFAGYEGHLIPARNQCWRTAVEVGARRVLWIDSDIYAHVGELEEFLDRSDRSFEREPKLAWIGAVCKRRGGGLALEVSDDPAKYPLLMGMGLAYWHTDRMKMALGGDPNTAFVWVPPFGEDYRACISAWDAGLKVKYDPTLPTKHLGVGDWEGAESIAP